MKSVNKPYRTAIFNALNGNLSYNGNNVPVYDELKSIADTTDVFVLFSTEQVTLDQYAELWKCTMNLDLEIYHRAGSEATKDVIDTIEDAIIGILFPVPAGTFGVIQPAGFQFMENWFQSSMTMTTSISPTQTIIRKILKISSIITQ